MKNTQSYKTKLKSLILGAFKDRSDGLMSASDVYKELTERGVSLNLTTVYRNLDAMTEDGVLMRFSEEGTGRKTYKYSGEGGGCRGHLHLKCTDCGEIIHLDCHFMHEIEAHTKAAHGFSISCEQSILLGVCEKCAGAGERSPSVFGEKGK